MLAVARPVNLAFGFPSNERDASHHMAAFMEVDLRTCQPDTLVDRINAVPALKTSAGKLFYFVSIDSYRCFFHVLLYCSVALLLLSRVLAGCKPAPPTIWTLYHKEISSRCIGPAGKFQLLKILAGPRSVNEAFRLLGSTEMI